MTEENRTKEYTDIQEQFLELLKKYPVKNAETVVDYVTSQGETVLEDPEKLAQALSECEISPVRRRQVLKHWFAEKGVEVTPELLKKVTLPPERRKEAEEKAKAEEESKKAKYSVDEDTGAIKVATSEEKALTWPEAEKLSKQIKKEIAERGKGKEVKYVYDSDDKTVRMAKEGEIGGTLEQAKELKKMAGEGKGQDGEESPFIQDKDGNWTLNPKARVTGVELFAMESMRKAQERGEPVDPIEALSQAAEKMKFFREAMGGTGAQLPDWMTDPAKFIETVERISGGGKVDEALKQQVTGLEKTLTDMREDRYREQIESQKQEIKTLGGKVGELTDRVADLGKPSTGRTEMDILHEIATEGIGVLKTELPGFRRDIKEAIGSTVLPPAKSADERKQRTTKLRQAVETDSEIEEIGRRLFFSES
ncbi:hypothetical protein ES705_47877 [subsurface metagenome]